MQKISHTSGSYHDSLAERVNGDGLRRQAHRWDKTVRRELISFARAVWPKRHKTSWLGWRSYRLRRRNEPGRIVWWIERDIPPYDRYQCASYQVELTEDDEGEALLSVRSGEGLYPVVPSNEKGLESTLDQIGDDDPLIIPRRMGVVTDP
jgi:hypothetical protein